MVWTIISSQKVKQQRWKHLFTNDSIVVQRAQKVSHTSLQCAKPAVTLVTYGGAMDIGKEVWSSSDRIIIMGDQKNAGIYAVCLYNHVLDFDWLTVYYT